MHFFIKKPAHVINIQMFITNSPNPKYVFTPSVDDFLKPGTVKNKIIEVRGEKISAPYFDINGEEIWGATAMIMNEFLEIIRQVK